MSHRATSRSALAVRGLAWQYRIALLYALDNSANTVEIVNLSGVSQGDIPLADGNWTGLAVTGSLLYALDNTANTVQIHNLLGLLLGSIPLGAGDWQGLSVHGSALYVLDDTKPEEVLPIDTTTEIIPALGRRESGAWTRIPITSVDALGSVSQARGYAESLHR